MQVGRWGNSLAIRLPASIVEMLELHEGDEIVIEIAGQRTFHIRGEPNREAALQRLRRLDWKLPPGFVLSRGGDGAK